MRHGFPVLFLMLMLMSSGCQKEGGSKPAKAVEVREDGLVKLHLLSFNVRYESPDDRGSRAWRLRVPGIVRMVRRLAPDCLGVQEALHGQAADLWASLPEYGFYGVGRDDGIRAGEYSGIYYRRDRFQLDTSDCGTFWLSATPEVPGSRTWGNEIPRVATWIRLVDRATGHGFYVYNTHWDHRNQESRECASLLIAARIDARRHAGEPVALIGDFNSIESNPGLVYLTGKTVTVAGEKRTWAHGLMDTYEALHSGEKKRRTLHLWSGSREGNLKVDHILVSRGSTITDSAVVWEDLPMVSDHFPVTARILLPPAD